MNISDETLMEITQLFLRCRKVKENIKGSGNLIFLGEVIASNLITIQGRTMKKLPTVLVNTWLFLATDKSEETENVTLLQ